MNAKASEEIINSLTLDNYTGCDEGTHKPTCGFQSAALGNVNSPSVSDLLMYL